ncbi:MAG: YybH family protein [Thermoanaerobaculaceae bacterium]
MDSIAPAVVVLALVLVPLSAVGRGAPSEDEVAAALLAQERSYLAELGRGNPDPFIVLTAPDVTYFEPELDARIDDRVSLARLFEPFRGQDLVPRFELANPRVQLYGDVAIVSFNWVGEERTEAGVRPSPWNASEVWQRQDGTWRIVSSHWSFTTPKGQPSVPRPTVPAERPLGGATAEVAAAERACLDRWIRGDPGGFVEAAASEIAYFDPTLERRIDGLEAFTKDMEPIRGKVAADRYELLNPRVQLVGELAVLTFNYQSFTRRPDGATASSFWNSTEVYRRVDGRWWLVHSHWSRTRATR